VKNPYPKETKDHKIWEEGFNVGFNAAIVAILAFAAELGKESFRKCLYEEGNEERKPPPPGPEREILKGI